MDKRKMVTFGEKIILGVTLLFLCALGTLAHTQSLESPPNTPLATVAVAQEDVVPDTALVNLNTATAEDLDALPGIGSVLAQRIVAYRTENGPFATREEVMNVWGIGEAIFAGIVDFIVIETS